MVLPNTDWSLLQRIRLNPVVSLIAGAHPVRTDAQQREARKEECVTSWDRDGIVLWKWFRGLQFKDVSLLSLSLYRRYSTETERANDLSAGHLFQSHWTDFGTAFASFLASVATLFHSQQKDVFHTIWTLHVHVTFFVDWLLSFGTDRCGFGRYFAKLVDLCVNTPNALLVSPRLGEPWAESFGRSTSEIWDSVGHTNSKFLLRWCLETMFSYFPWWND